MATEATKKALRSWRWADGTSPFVTLLKRKQRELKKSWTYDRTMRLCNLGKFTEDELWTMVGASSFDKTRMKNGDSASTSLALNLQRLEDYVIHRRIGVRPQMRPEDAVLVKILNREPETEKEPAC